LLPHLEGYPLSLSEGPVPFAGHVRVVYEQLFVTAIRDDEAVALLLIEPPDRSLLDRDSPIPPSRWYLHSGYIA